MKGYRYLEEDDSDESDSEHSEEEEEEDGEGQGAEETDEEDGVGEQPAGSQGSASPAAPRTAAEIHHRRRDNAQGKEGGREERAGGCDK